MTADDDQHRIAALRASRDVDQRVREGATEGSARAATTAIPDGIVAGNVKVAVPIVQLVINAELKRVGDRLCELGREGRVRLNGADGGGLDGGLPR